MGTGAPGLPSPSPCPAPSPPLHPESPCGPRGPVGQQGLSSVLSPSLHPSRSPGGQHRGLEFCVLGGFPTVVAFLGFSPAGQGSHGHGPLFVTGSRRGGPCPTPDTVLPTPYPKIRQLSPPSTQASGAERQEGPCGRFREKRRLLRIKHGKPFSAELKLNYSHTKSNKNNNGQLLVFFCEPGPRYGVPVLCHRASRLDGRPGSCRRPSL